MRRNAKREAARGAAGEWEGAVDEWEGAGEHAAQTMEQGASGDFASGEPSPPPPIPSSPSPVDLGEVCMDLRGQLLEEKEAGLQARKRALDEREQALQQQSVRASGQLRVVVDLRNQFLQLQRKVRASPCPPHSSASTPISTPASHFGTGGRAKFSTFPTARMAHDLNILHSKMAHSKSAGKLIAELPAVHALTAQLKEAKNGTTEARHLHDKIKVHLHSIGSQLLEGKVEHEQMANAVKRNADAIHARSKKIGKL